MIEPISKADKLRRAACPHQAAERGQAAPAGATQAGKVRKHAGRERRAGREGGKDARAMPARYYHPG